MTALIGIPMQTEHRIKLAYGCIPACLEPGEPDSSPVVYCHGYPGSRLEARFAVAAAHRSAFRLSDPGRPSLATVHGCLTLRMAVGKIRMANWVVPAARRG